MKPTKPPTTEPARARRGRRPIETITEPQRRTVAAIRAFASKRGYPPTMDELGEILGVAAATAHEQVTQLGDLVGDPLVAEVEPLLALGPAENRLAAADTAADLHFLLLQDVPA